MKKIITLAMTAMIVVLLAACGSGNSKNVITSKAGNITEEELLNELLQSQDAEVIIRTAVLKRVLDDQYDVSDEDVEKRLEELKENAGDNYDLILQSQGITEEQLIDDLKLALLQEQAFADGLDITDEDFEAFYEMMSEEVEASHILVEDEEQAKDLIKQLEDGADFAELANEHSIDPGTAENGGEVGFFSVNQFVFEFTEAAHALDVGQISEPIKSDFGYHIIKVTDKRDVEDIGTLEENRSFIFQSLIEAKMSQDEANKKLNQLILDANVEVKLDQFKDLFKPTAAEDEDKNEDETNDNGNGENSDENDSDAPNDSNNSNE